MYDMGRTTNPFLPERRWHHGLKLGGERFGWNTLRVVVFLQRKGPCVCVGRALQPLPVVLKSGYKWPGRRADKYLKSPGTEAPARGGLLSTEGGLFSRRRWLWLNGRLCPGIVALAVDGVQAWRGCVEVGANGMGCQRCIATRNHDVRSFLPASFGPDQARK